MTIKHITWQQTLDLRSRVLRPGYPIEDSHFKGDDDPQTIHYGAFDGDSIVGVATFLPEKFADLKAANPSRLRGMAVDPSRRRSGAGRAIIEYAEHELRTRGVDLIWFNAREVAFPFYSALGFDFFGALFDLPGIGPHKVMFKRF